MPFEDQRTRSPSACLRVRGFWGRTWGRTLTLILSLSLSLYFSLFGGRLMKYPCQFNRVTSAVPSHPKSSDDPRAGALLSLQARRNILSANKPSPFVASPLGSSGPSYPLRTPFAAAFSIVPAFCKSPAWLNSFA